MLLVCITNVDDSLASPKKFLEVKTMEYEMLVRNSHGVSQNTFHLVWTTKYRHPVFKRRAFQKVAEDFILRAAKRHGIEVFECRVMPDHVHLFARLPRTLSVDKAFQLLKGNSSYYLRRYCWPMLKYRALWSPFTFSRTVGSVTGEVIEYYIRESQDKGRYGSQVSLSRYSGHDG